MAAREAARGTSKRGASAKGGRLRDAVATVGMLAMAAGSIAGAYLGFRFGGLGAGFIGALAGGAIGFGLVYVITNVVRQNSKLFTLIIAMTVIGLIAWGLHALGSVLGFNPR
ncbi:MAG: hypothetical protein ACKVP7_19490 [Hyphomicrobiaceae bacterium]